MNLIKIIHLYSHRGSNILSKTKSNFTETFFKIKPRLKCNYFSSQSEQPIISKARTFTIKSPLKLTQSAAKRISELLENQKDAIGIRISVKKRGCNGYSYNMNYVTEKEQNNRKDEVVDSHGVKVFVDPAALFFIVGTEMNYEETELSSEFTFTNPNSKGQCGCGESFNV